MFKWIYKWTDKIKEKVATLSDKMSEKGQGIVEYGMILAAVAVIAFFVLWSTDNTNNLKGIIEGTFNTAATKIKASDTEAGK